MAKNILILYATNSGGTEFSSGIIEKTLKEAGNNVTVKKVSTSTPDEINNFDVVLFGSPSWDYKGKEGQVHQDYLPFMEKINGMTFKGKQFAVFGLGDTSYAYFTGAATHLEELVKTIEGEKVIDALRIDGFYFDQENNEKLVEQWAKNLSEKLG